LTQPEDETLFIQTLATPDTQMPCTQQSHTVYKYNCMHAQRSQFCFWLCWHDSNQIATQNWGKEGGEHVCKTPTVWKSQNIHTDVTCGQAVKSIWRVPGIGSPILYSQ